MIKIALVGAAEAGKSKLALELKEALGDIEIIDGYVEDIERDSGWAAGPFSSYMMGLMIVSERIKRELGCESKKQSHITCGTIVESAAYLAMRAVAMTKYESRDEINADIHALSTIGMIAASSWWYDHVFYLPLPEGKGDPLDDHEVQASLETFGITYARLDEPKRLETALAIIKQGTEVEATPLDESTV